MVGEKREVKGVSRENEGIYCGNVRIWLGIAGIEGVKDSEGRRSLGGWEENTALL